MMKILSVSSNRIFVPEFDDNKDLPSGEQIRVKYKAPTISMKEKLFPRQIDYIDGKPQISIAIDRVKLLKELVTGIENLSYAIEEADGKVEEKKIVTVEQLFSASVEFDALVEEIFTFLNEVLNGKVNEKN
jgi:hypothetical protein